MDLPTTSDKSKPGKIPDEKKKALDLLVTGEDKKPGKSTDKDKKTPDSATTSNNKIGDNSNDKKAQDAPSTSNNKSGNNLNDKKESEVTVTMGDNNNKKPQDVSNDKKSTTAVASAVSSSANSKENAHLASRIRFILVICLIYLYTLRFDMPTVILVMTDASWANAESKEWQWDRLTEGWILSSFFWGYAVGQIFTGISISRLPRNEIPGVFSPWISGCVMASGALTLFNLILSTHGDWQLLCVSRAVVGLLQGIAVPLVYKILVHLTPEKEHQYVGSLIWMTALFGAVIAPVMSSSLMPREGWPLVFTVIGIFAVAVGFVSLFFMREECLAKFSPPKNSTVQGSVRTRDDPIPWTSILNFRGFWAIFFSSICQTWCFWLLATQLPLYLKHVVGYSLAETGRSITISYAVALLVCMIVLIIVPSCVDVERPRRSLTKVLFRKIFNSVSFWVPAAALILLGALPDQTHWLNFSLLIIAMGFNAFVGLGYLNNAYDMTKKFAGDIIGVTNVVANLFAISAPIVAALVVSDPTSHHQWGILLYVTAAVYIAGNVFFVIFGSGAQQSWDKVDEPLRTVD